MSATIPRRRRELARRISGNLEVTLYWSADDDSTSIDIWHFGSEQSLVFAVPRDRALDAFYHPFAHLPVTVDEPSPALEAVDRL
jgi:hypothetical protein